jgi:hypothetical protein
MTLKSHQKQQKSTKIDEKKVVKSDGTNDKFSSNKKKQKHAKKTKKKALNHEDAKKAPFFMHFFFSKYSKTKQSCYNSEKECPFLLNEICV